MAVWQDGGLLLVRSCYRPGLDLPGGGIASDETALEAAVRELREETGLSARSGELRAAGAFRFEAEHRRITAHVHVWRPAVPIAPVADGREIVWAGFVPAAALPSSPLTELPRLYLAHAAQAPTGTCQISRA